MSWLFSRALVEEYSEATCSDGVPSAPLNVMPTPHKFWRNDKTMEPYQLSRFGLTCAVLTEDRGEALLTWFRADSRVRTYPLPGMEPASMVSVPASGAKWLESSVRFDRDSCSWRTHLCLWGEALPWSSVTLPRWGMTRNGYVYRHPTAERPISATAFGLWPTPTVTGNNNAPKEGTKRGTGLATAARLWATPQAHDAMKGYAHRVGRFGSKAGGRNLNDEAVLSTGLGVGQLNPTWVEWLMGWPMGWTDLKPLETAKFLEWRQQHSPFSRLNGSEAA